MAQTESFLNDKYTNDPVIKEKADSIYETMDIKQKEYLCAFVGEEKGKKAGRSKRTEEPEKIKCINETFCQDRETKDRFKVKDVLKDLDFNCIGDLKDAKIDCKSQSGKKM